MVLGRFATAEEAALAAARYARDNPTRPREKPTKPQPATGSPADVPASPAPKRAEAPGPAPGPASQDYQGTSGPSDACERACHWGRFRGRSAT